MIMPRISHGKVEELFAPAARRRRFTGALRRPGSLASFPIPDFREGSGLEEGDRGEEDIAREDEIPLV